MKWTKPWRLDGWDIVDYDDGCVILSNFKTKNIMPLSTIKLPKLVQELMQESYNRGRIDKEKQIQNALGFLTRR